MPKLALAVSGSETLATSLYDRIRAEVLAGKLEPARKLQIEFLCERYSAGQTPVREALNRLTSDGLVERREQRGFAVAPVSIADLKEITKTRCWLEEVALRESLANRSAVWEEALVLAHHRLMKMPRSSSSAGYEENPAWEALHKAFHNALIGACQSRWLIAFCEQLADQLYRYRQLAVHRTYPNRHERVEHQAIVDAVLADDADQAVKLLNKHYQETADIILADARLFVEPAN
ncbi:MAG: transcriptional regulator, GntR family [Betaproteobacteria bacterium]|nr:transcriptional regulator, GntR family [Betaproteobacteria bacterium]